MSLDFNEADEMRKEKRNHPLTFLLVLPSVFQLYSAISLVNYLIIIHISTLTFLLENVE
jgi:hypothetical protein